MSTLTVESCDSEDELRVGFGASRGTCGGGADSSWRVRAVFAFALRYASPGTLRSAVVCARAAGPVGVWPCCNDKRIPYNTIASVRCARLCTF